MRTVTIGILAVGAIAVAGCGSSGKFANRPRPATPVNLTVYINDARVSVSPASVGAGPVEFIITNQSSQAQSLSIVPSGAASALAESGPINPQATTQVEVNLASPGVYTVATGASGSPIQAAALRVGKPRPNSNSTLLQP